MCKVTQINAHVAVKALRKQAAKNVTKQHNVIANLNTAIEHITCKHTLQVLVTQRTLAQAKANFYSMQIAHNNYTCTFKQLVNNMGLLALATATNTQTMHAQSAYAVFENNTQVVSVAKNNVTVAAVN